MLFFFLGILYCFQIKFVQLLVHKCHWKVKLYVWSANFIFLNIIHVIFIVVTCSWYSAPEHYLLSRYYGKKHHYCLQNIIPQHWLINLLTFMPKDMLFHIEKQIFEHFWYWQCCDEGLEIHIIWLKFENIRKANP